MRRILQSSHVRSGEEMTASETVDMGELVKGLCEGRCEMECHDDFSILGDAHLLRMAFKNIVNNAVKYSDGKPVTVTVREHKVVIRDEGIGIPKEDIPHVFEPFYRASNTGSVIGHGVGLALAKAILEKHNARLTMASRQNEGTIVTVVFL